MAKPNKMRGCDLFAYQKEGAKWLASRTHALFAWDMGTGKTPTATVAADAINARRVLIVCPAIARSVWADTLSQWSDTSRAVYVLRSGRSPLPAPGRPCVIVVSYDLLASPKSPVLRTIWEQGQQDPFDVLICDEAHALKTPDANRTRAIYGKKIDGKTGLAAVSKRVWLLTGTPVLNAAHEVWTHLHALTPDAITNAQGKPMPYYEFIDTFCETRNTVFGLKITGSKNQHKLAERMSSFMSRVRLKDVIQDMPPLTCAAVPVSVADAKIPPDVMREFREAEGRARAEFGPSLYSMDTTGESEGDDFLTALKAAQMALASERRLTGLVKAPIVADLVRQDLMGNDQKIIVFAHHTKVIDALAEALADLGVVVVDGRTTDKEREQRVRDFQADPDVRVFVGQLQACATAVTLTAARNVLFAEADWTPALNHQAACRAHRIGQKHPVLARFVVLEGTLDARIMRLLARKTQEIAALMGGDENPLGLGATAVTPTNTTAHSI